MKKVLSIITALVICIVMAAPVMADEFVPSITYKDAPEVSGAVMNDQNVGGSLIITSIIQAEKKTTEITQAERDLLLDVYDKLENDIVDLPVEGGFVIRDLFDVSFPTHDEETLVKLTFNLGVVATAEVVALQYKNNEWKAVKTTNNGDGTVTCEFTHFCPVAFAVKSSESPDTGDTLSQSMGIWMGVLAVSAVAVVFVIANRRKFFK